VDPRHWAISGNSRIKIPPMSLPCAARLLLLMANQCLVVRSQAIQLCKRYDDYLVMRSITKETSMSGRRSLTFAGSQRLFFAKQLPTPCPVAYLEP
jgi:hypothetical protein